MRAAACFVVVVVVIAGACNKTPPAPAVTTPTPTPTTLVPTMPTSTPTKDTVSTPSSQLALPYFPHEPATQQTIEHHGPGCAPDFENCGVVYGGAASDVGRVEFSCVSPPAPVTLPSLPSVQPTIERWRAALEQREGALVAQEPADEVARADVDGDGHVDRVLAVRADVKETEENGDGYGPGSCGGLFVDFGDAVVVVADDVCDAAGQRVDAFNQLFRLQGEPGVFLHVRHVERGANGGSLFHVVGRTITRLPLPRCSGNG